MMTMRLTTIARTGRRMKTSVNFTLLTSPILGVRRQLGFGLHRVVYRDRGAVVELEGSRRNDLLARDEPVEHGDEIAARVSELDELLASGFRRSGGRCHDVSLGVFAVFHDEDRVTEGRVDDRLYRDDDDVALVGQDNRHLCEHARQ